MRLTVLLVWIAAIVLGLPLPFHGKGKAKDKSEPAATPLSELVAAESQLTADAAHLGVRAAFLKWLAEGSLAFHPHPMSARDVYTALPAAKSGFARHPERIVLSDSEDFALSQGTWTYKADSAQAKVDVYGVFTTIWRREKDAWKIALDCGLPHDAPATAPGTLPIRTVVMSHETRGGGDSRGTLAQAEVEFAAAAAAHGVPWALGQYGSDDLAVMRWGAQPLTRAIIVRDSLGGLDAHVTLRPRERVVADSGDLGYGYGDFLRRRGAVADSTNYLHVWQREKDKQWRLIVDYVEGAPRKVR